MPVPTSIQEQVAALRGRKALVATRAFHNVCGLVDGLRGDRLVVRVQGREVSIDGYAVVSLHEVPPEHAEYVL